MSSPVTVLGAGTWGTALSILLANKGEKVILWSKIEAEIESLRADRSFIKNLPGSVLPDSVELTTDYTYACRDSEPKLIVFAVASPYVRQTAKLVAPVIRQGQRIVNVAKGIEEATLDTILDILHEEIPGTDASVLSGPSHAEEVSRLIPTTVVVASEYRETAEFIQDIFMTEYFRVYTSNDIIGVELGGSIKNVIALAAGMSDGLGFGDNTKAALMTRGIHEIARLGKACGADVATFSGLTGIGDLIVTCTSMHSRNRRAGILIGQGISPDEAVKRVGTVEGYHCCKAAYQLAKKMNVEMPITEQLNRVLFEGENIREVLGKLMNRPQRNEVF